jgi:DNA-binding GntR family transcriptional regulator
LPARSRTLATDVFDRLRSDILHCRVDPGMRLTFSYMRQRYAAGLSPAREALMRLAAGGLVQWNDLKGFRVAPAFREEMVDTGSPCQESGRP